jgi:CelD/BcsL family acetyltransferase involved in cellulose biosynthesis
MVPASSALNGWRDRLAGLSVVPGRTCYLADLTGGFEAYLERLSKSTRKDFRQLLRAARAEGAEFALASDLASADLFFEQLIRVHQQRWEAVGEAGCFARPRRREFHRFLARKWVPEGKAVIARLSLAGEPIALQYGFLVRCKFDAYIHAARRMERTSAVRSPGNAIQLLLMAELAGRGVTAYDQLHGNERSYKRHLATNEQPLVRIRLLRPTFRGSVKRVSEAVEATARSRLRQLLRRG